MTTEDGERNGGRGERDAMGCAEARGNIVALQGDELSPLRAESVRAHLASCPECREAALELEIAARSVAGLPEVVPPGGLLERTMRRILEALGWQEGSDQPAAMPPCLPADAPEPAAATGFRTSVLFRPVRNPFARVAAAAAAAVAAAFLIVAVSLAFPNVSEKVGNAQMKLLGPRISSVIDRASDAVLKKLSM